MKIDPEQFRFLAEIAYAIADPASPPAEEAIGRAHAAGLSAASIAEAILQGIPYSGFPGAVEALGSLRSIARSSSEEPDSRRPRGEENPGANDETPPAFTAVYREGASAVRAALRERHPALERWIIEFAYGEVMGRDEFGMFELEGLAVASLIAQRRTTPLHSHLRGALRNGWSSENLNALVETLATDGDPATIAFAREIIAREGS